MTRWPVLVASVLVLGGFLTALAFLAAAATETKAPEAHPPLPVRVELAEPVTFYQRARIFTGIVEARRQSELSFERGGRLLEVRADEGQSVTAGQILAVLDSRHLHAQQAALAAELRAARALLDELQAGPRAQTIAGAAAQVQELQADFQLQQDVHERNERLLRSQSIAREQFEQSRFQLQAGAARLEAAQQKLAELKEGTREERVAAQQALVAQLEASLEDVQLSLDDTRLAAPFAGRLGRRMLDEGTVVAAGQPVFRLIESDHLEIRIGVPASLAANLQPDQSQPVRVGEIDLPAKVIAVLPELDLATRTQVVLLSLPQSENRSAVPGQVARVPLSDRVALSEPGFWLPTDALARGNRGLWSVYVLQQQDDSTVVGRRDVEVLYTEGERVLVRGTLQAGDSVIITGPHRVVPGQSVVAASKLDARSPLAAQPDDALGDTALGDTALGDTVP